LADVPLHQHWGDIYMKRWLVVLTATSSAVTAYIFSSLVTPVYEAKTTFYLAANATPVSYVGPSPDAPPLPLLPLPEEKAAALDVGILRGREVRTRLADEFDLSVAEIARRVDVTVSGEFMIDVFVRNPDPDLAAEIANEVPAVYSEFHEGSMRARATELATALSKRLETLKQLQMDLLTRQRDSRSASLTTADDAALDKLQSEIETAQSDRNNLAGQIDSAMARQGALQAALQKEAAYYETAKTVDTTPTLDRLLESILSLQVDLAALNDGKTNPRRTAVEEQIGRLEDAVAAERRRLAEASIKVSGSLYEELRRELALNDATIAELESSLSAADARISQATNRFDAVLVAMEVAQDATSELSRVEVQIATAEANLAAARLQAENAKPPLVIVEKAVPPSRPAFPLPIVNAIAAALCGAILGTYYALFVAHSERAAQTKKSRNATIPLFSNDELDELMGAVAAMRRSNGGRDANASAHSS
jgi:polysaccharide biosynthesis transport protein